MHTARHVPFLTQLQVSAATPKYFAFEFTELKNSCPALEVEETQRKYTVPLQTGVAMPHVHVPGI